MSPIKGEDKRATTLPDSSGKEVSSGAHASTASSANPIVMSSYEGIDITAVNVDDNIERSNKRQSLPIRVARKRHPHSSNIINNSNSNNSSAGSMTPGSMRNDDNSEDKQSTQGSNNVSKSAERSFILLPSIPQLPKARSKAENGTNSNYLHSDSHGLSSVHSNKVRKISHSQNLNKMQDKPYNVARESVALPLALPPLRDLNGNESNVPSTNGHIIGLQKKSKFSLYSGKMLKLSVQKEHDISRDNFPNPESSTSTSFSDSNNMREWYKMMIANSSLSSNNGSNSGSSNINPRPILSRVDVHKLSTHIANQLSQLQREFGKKTHTSEPTNQNGVGNNGTKNTKKCNGQNAPDTIGVVDVDQQDALLASKQYAVLNEAMAELVKQVSSECIERGRLMDWIWTSAGTLWTNAIRSSTSNKSSSINSTQIDNVSLMKSRNIDSASYDLGRTSARDARPVAPPEISTVNIMALRQQHMQHMDEMLDRRKKLLESLHK